MPRKQRKIKLFWKILISLKLFLLLLTGVLYLFIYSGVFEVKSMEISGSKHYEESFLKTNLSTEILKNSNYLEYLGSSNTLFWKFGHSKGLLPLNSNLSYLKSAKVKHDILDGQVSIFLTEKDYHGVICVSNRECFAYDDNGVIFSPAPFVKGPLIIRVDYPTLGTVNFGNRFLPNQEWINNLFETINILKESGFYPITITLKQLELREFEVVINSGVTFHFNLEFVPDEFRDVLEALDRKLDIESINYVDFRVPGRIYHQ